MEIQGCRVFKAGEIASTKVLRGESTWYVQQRERRQVAADYQLERRVI